MQSFAQSIVETVREPLLVLDAELRVREANAAFYRAFRLSPEHTVGRPVHEMADGQWDIPALRRLLDEVNATGRALSDFELIHDFPGLARRALLLNARRVSREGDPAPLILLAIEDVTEKKAQEEAEAARKQAEVERDHLLAHLRLQIERLPLACILFDAQHRVLDWNPAAEEIFGYTRAEVVGRVALDLYLPLPIPDQVQDVLRRVEAGDMDAHSVNENRTRDGRVILCEWFNTPLRDADGRYAGAISVAQEITERKRAEEALDYLAAIVESSEDAIIAEDLDGTITSWNRGAEQLYGYTAAEVVGRPLSILAPPDQPDELPGMIERLRRGEPIAHYETVRLRRDGSRVDVSLTISPVRNSTGQIIGASKVARDISDRKRAEEALRVANEQLDLAMRGSNLGIWDVDVAPGGDYRRVPVRFLNIWEQLGYDPAEFPMDASASRALGHPDDLAGVDVAVAGCLAGETEEIRVENRIRHKDGSYRWLLSLGKAVRDAAGRPVRLVGTVLDITERKRAEEALRDSEARLAAELAGMKRLQEISTRLVQATDPVPLLEVILDAAIAITAADMGNMQLLDQVTGSLRFVTSRGLGPAYLEHFGTVHDGRTSCGAAMEAGARVVIGDVTQSVFTGKDLEVMLAAGVRALQATPLVGRSGRLVGMLSTHYRRPRVPAERDLGVLDLLARQAADWVERTRAEEAMRETHDELEKRVDERTAELARANETLYAEVRERRQSEEARTVLLRQLETAQEAERRRISHELHDQVGQQLTSLTLGLKALRDAPFPVPPTSGERRRGALNRKVLERLQKTAEDVGRAVHGLALRLRPTALDDLGLNAALQSAVEEWSRRTGVEADFHGTGLEGRRLPGAVETALYRVVLEALHNTLKHARARHVSVLLECRNHHAVAIVEDDGAGFDAEAVLIRPPPGRLGFLGMRERMALVGGTLEVESTPGTGTTVFARVPLGCEGEGGPP